MAWFMFWMLLASSLGFVKVIALAYSLDVEAYGVYIAIFGVSTLAGAIASFGLLERTIKLYPRQWAAGKQLQILADAKLIVKRLLFRFLVFGFVGVIITNAIGLPFSWIEVISVGLLGLGSAWLSVFASLFRAVGSRIALQKFSIWRSGLACVFALIGGWRWGWSGAIAGDVLASSATACFAIGSLKKLYARMPDIQRDSGSLEKNEEVDSGHDDLYFANMISAATVMADRALVGSSLGPAAAGAYGVIMLMPQVFQMLVNVISQYIGPLVIKLVYLQRSDQSKFSELRLQSILLSLLAVICVVFVLLARRLSFIETLFDKYAISDLALILAGLISAGQIYCLIEFHLIAYDCERQVFVASFWAGLLFLMLFAIGAYQSLAVEYFVAAAAMARWQQVGMLTSALARVNQKV